MVIAKLVVLVLHIASAAVIFGSSMGAARSLRAGLAAGPKAFGVVSAGAARRGSLSLVASLVTLLTGVVLIFMAGGFGAVKPNFHAALTLMMVAIGLSAFFSAPRIKKLVQLSKSEAPDTTAATALIKQVGMGVGISHALWIVILVLMLYRL